MEVPSYEFDGIIEKNARKKYSCPICQEVIISATKVNCNHRFCQYCITKWMTFFKDCPVCGTQITQKASHARTDKWIQQLYDLATLEFRQDREMCINYRKLQHTKMELVGVQELSCNFTINHDQLLEEFGLSVRSDAENKCTYQGEVRITGNPVKQLLLDNSNLIPNRSKLLNTPIEKNQNSREPGKPNSNTRFHHGRGPDSSENMQNLNPVPIPNSRPNQDLDMKSLYFTNALSRKTMPSVTQLTEMFNRPHNVAKDVTQLFGATSPSNFSDAMLRENKYDNSEGDIQNYNYNLHSPHSRGNNLDYEETFTVPHSSILNSDIPTEADQTYTSHYPGNINPSKLLTLAELTCHDDLVMVNDDDDDDETSQIPKLSETQNTDGTGMGAGDTILADPRLAIHETENPSEMAQSLNAIKAETMRARLQHEIAKAMMPPLKPVKSPSRGDCPGGLPKSSNSQKEQDLQSCREALLNLRLRLLPPAKRNEPLSTKEKRIVSDSKFPINSNVDANKLCSLNASKREPFKQVKEMMKDAELLPKKYRSIQKMESFTENK